jgi:Zn-dependent protease
MNNNIIQQIAIWTVPVLLALIVHEVAHGWVASLFGDKTALMLGRLTLNPRKHIDLIGTIIMPLLCLFVGGIIFGWAKPVPINSRNFKNFRRDMVLVAAAGPISNFLMALMWAMFTKVAILLFIQDPITLIKLFFIPMGYAGIFINLLLMVFNLIPIPPLDGSRVVASLLPSGAAKVYGLVEQYGFIILMLLIYTNILSLIIEPPFLWIQNAIFSVFAIE